MKLAELPARELAHRDEGLPEEWFGDPPARATHDIGQHSRAKESS
jgi:hypothetical protein